MNLPGIWDLFSHRLPGLFLPISILKSRVLRLPWQPWTWSTFNQQYFHFPGQGRLGPFRILIHSQGRCHSYIIEFPPRLNYVVRFYHHYPCLEASLTWVSCHSSCQEMVVQVGGSPPSAPVRAGRHISVPYCAVRGSSLTPCTFCSLLSYRAFYVLILFSNHIIFQRIGKSGNLFLHQWKKHSKTLVLCICKKKKKLHALFVVGLCCSVLTSGILFHLPWKWEVLCVAMEMVIYCFQLY